MPDNNQVIDLFRQERLGYINLWFVDIQGGVKSIIIPAERIEEVLEQGVLFDGSSLEGGARLGGTRTAPDSGQRHLCHPALGPPGRARGPP